MRYDFAAAPTSLNMELTPEQEREVAFFNRWGYLLVEDTLTPEQVETLRQALDEAVERKNAFMFGQLLEEDDRFGFLVDNPPVLTRMKALLGNCIQLHSATARVTRPGEPDQNWHRDGPWPIAPGGTPYGSLPAQINCGYYLDELTPELGPVGIVPGSHRAPFRPPASPVSFPDEKFILAKPGQAVMFDGWLYHRGCANTSEQRRRVCLMCYQNAWMKSREPFDGPRVTKLREEGSLERKLILGVIPRW